MKYLILIFLIGCGGFSEYKKPFIIVGKRNGGYVCSGKDYSYKFVDANGHVYTFCESTEKYSIGDTIK